MKIKILPFILFYSILSFGQRITLNELQVFCNNKSWETTNKALLAQKWDYYDSSEGDDEHYNVTKWAYGRNTYDDSRATAWLELYSYDGLPNKVSYRFRNKEYYNAIQNQIKANNYKQTTENIFDSRVTVTYENSTYFLQLAYNRVEDEDDNYYGSNNKTYTVFDVTVFKKGGVYDPDNGLKKDYDDDGNIIAVYTLKNGKINGDLLNYFPNGKLKRKSTLVNGLYEGNYEMYSYLDNGDTFKTHGIYKNDQQEGKWISEIIENDTKYVVKEEFFSNGSREGKAVEANSESEIIFKNYSNDKLNGNVKTFLNINRSLIGGYPSIDTLNISKVKMEELNYFDDKLNGTAKRFDISGSLIEEGKYLDSLKTGEWKFYHKNISDENGNKLDYAGKIYLIENYSKGKLNGKYEQFSFLDEIKISCKNPNEEGCSKLEVVYFDLLCYYKDDELEGEYILKNSSGNLVKKGTYLSGNKNGKWIQYGDTEFSDYNSVIPSYETGAYINNIKENKWERFAENGNLLESYQYKNDKIHGKHIEFLQSNNQLVRYFNYGVLDKVEYINDKNKIIRSIEIISNNSKDFVVKDINASNDKVELTTLKIDKIATNFEIEPQYFYKKFLNIDTNYRLKNGLYELQTNDNKLISSGYYANNTKNNQWTDIYYDQEIKTTFKYNYGKLYEEYYYDLKKNEPLSGEFIFTDTENNITEERKIKNGKRHGTTRYKDQNDKTIRKESYKEGELKE
jgi:antitoxin component YwqK of YwqJK toxin-antitoxin module